MAAKKKIPSPAKNKPGSGIKKGTSSVGKRPAAAGRTRTTARKKPAATGKKRRHSSQKMTEEMLYYIKRVRFIRGIVLLCLTLLLTLLFFMTGENIWQALHNCYLGVFGFSGILLPVLLLYCAVQMFRERSTYRLPLKILFLSGTIFMLATTVYAFSSSGMELKEVEVNKGTIQPVPHIRRGFDNKVKQAAETVISEVQAEINRFERGG